MASVFGIDRPSSLSSSVVNLNQRLDVLQIQLATGRKSQTFSGLGPSRTISLDLRGEITKTERYQKTIDTVSMRMDVAALAVTRVDKILIDTKSQLRMGAYEVGGYGQTPAQAGSTEYAQEVIALLNSEIGGSYIFAGKESANRPVENIAKILDGEAGADGLRTVIAERDSADTGADGLGRLVLPSAVAGAVSLSEDAAGHPFGAKLNVVASGLTGTTVVGPAGAPAAIDVTFSATPPLAGETLSITFDLPDGSTEIIALTATDNIPPAKDEFLIGANATESGDNFQAVLKTSIELMVATSVRAASANQASVEFFEFDAGNPPLRVDGPPFDTATALINATAADTVFWYDGEIETADPRASVKATINDGHTLEYGLRANESALRDTLKFNALLAVLTFDEAVVTDRDRYRDIQERLAPDLASSGNGPSVRQIATEIALKQQVLGTTDRQHDTAISLAKTLLDDSEGIDINEVGARILSLQTRLQASYEATSILSQLRLVNFI